MLSVCHDAIRDRQITNRTCDDSIKGVSMAPIGSEGNKDTQNPLVHAIHDDVPTTTATSLEKQKPKIPFWDRATANMVHGLVTLRLCVFVDEEENFGPQ